MNEICTVYHEAETVHENGGHTISVDEMTGIQALEHKYPDKPVIPGKTARMEFEYIRHGTISLIGFFDVATGRMEKPYLNPTRTEDDFVEAIHALVETDPEAPWTICLRWFKHTQIRKSGTLCCRAVWIARRSWQ